MSNMSITNEQLRNDNVTGDFTPMINKQSNYYTNEYPSVNQQISQNSLISGNILSDPINGNININGWETSQNNNNIPINSNANSPNSGNILIQPQFNTGVHPMYTPPEKSIYTYDLDKTAFKYSGITGSIIAGFNDFLTREVELVQNSYPIELRNGKRIFIGQPLFIEPRKSDVNIPNTDPNEPLAPLECRNNGFTYALSSFSRAHVEDANGHASDYKSDYFPIGKIPVMLGSQACNLKKLTADQLLEVGEDPDDPFGYFIIKGGERVIITQERLASDHIFCFYSEKHNYYACEFNSMTEAGISSVMLKHKRRQKAPRIGEITAALQITKNNDVNFAVMFAILGVTETQDISGYLYDQVPVKDHLTFSRFINPSLEAYEQLKSKSKTGLFELFTENVTEEFIENFRNKIFDQMFASMNELPIFEELQGIDRRAVMLEMKLNYFSLMIYRLFQGITGKRKLDNRDDYTNKRVYSARKAYQVLINSFKERFDKYQNLDNATDAMLLAELMKYVGESKKAIDDTFDHAFKTGKWGIKGSSAIREEVTELVHRESLIAAYANMRRLQAPSKDIKRSRPPRYLNGTHWMSICVTGDTEILMADRSVKPIKDIKDGEIVVTVDQNTLEETPSRIFNKFEIMPEKLIELSLETGHKIRCTEDHPLLVRRDDKNGWLKTVDMEVGDVLCVKDPNGISEKYQKLYFKQGDAYFVPIKTKEYITPELVYDFTTDTENHSFIANFVVNRNCPAETPEGEKVGIVKQLSFLAIYSIYRDDRYIIERLQSRIHQIPQEGDYRIFINAKWLGYGEYEIYNDLIAWKRSLETHEDVSILINEIDKDIFYYSDAGRVLHPVFVVDDDGELVIRKKNLLTANMKTLIANGCVEYIDSSEMSQEHVRIALWEEDLLHAREHNDELSRGVNNRKYFQTSKPVIYSYLEFHPYTLHGMAASLTPYPGHMQGPRDTYQAGMVKQAIGTFHINHRRRHDTGAKVLIHGERAIAQTRSHDILGMNRHPFGVNCVTEIGMFLGNNQEDSLVFKKGAIERGLFWTYSYRTYKFELKGEEFPAFPEIRSKEDPAIYSALDENGIAKEGAFVKEGYILLSRSRGSAKQNQTKFDTVRISEYGIVDSVYRSTSNNGRQIRIKVRTFRQPKVGDKFASRYAQKGIMGYIANDEDMPYNQKTGLAPDVIINPHAFPSRMTEGMKIESDTSKTAAHLGQFVDCTGFKKVNLQPWHEMLVAMGYEYKGEEEVVNGVTGEKYRIAVFRGMVHYQALKHMVEDKYNARSKQGKPSSKTGEGRNDRLKHQPIERRMNKGGIRFGRSSGIGTLQLFPKTGESGLARVRWKIELTIYFGIS
jgi:DNA-directed RNA polymerase beta subunit